MGQIKNIKLHIVTDIKVTSLIDKPQQQQQNGLQAIHPSGSCRLRRQREVCRKTCRCRGCRRPRTCSVRESRPWRAQASVSIPGPEHHRHCHQHSTWCTWWCHQKAIRCSRRRCSVGQNRMGEEDCRTGGETKPFGLRTVQSESGETTEGEEDQGDRHTTEETEVNNNNNNNNNN